MTTVALLSALPEPEIIESLNFETIFSELKADFISRYPGFTAALESEPVMKLLEVAAYREVLLRNRINDAARANLLAFATGSDLDHLAAFYGVIRLSAEDDTALRLRTRQRIVGFANAGGAAHYRYWALSAAPEVADVEVDSPEPGRVRISVLAKGSATTVAQSVLEAVKTLVLRDDIRVLTDTISVVAAELLPISVSANIWLLPDAPSETLDAIKAAFLAALADQAGLGWDLTLSWIIGQLHRPGVHRVDLLSPTANTPAGAHQAVRLTQITLNLMGRDR